MPVHPVFAHFPVALTFASFLFEVLEMFFKEKFKNSSLILSLLTLFFLLISLQTGNLESEKIQQVGSESEVLNSHRNFATASVLAFVSAFLIKVYFTLRKTYSGKAHLALILIYLLCLVLVFRTAYLGTKLVFEYGINQH